MATITHKGNPIHTAGDLPAVGATAPDFTLTRGDLSDVRMIDFAGKRIVMNIFPSIDTGICATSVRHFNQAAADLDDTVVLCISRDLPFALARFCGAEGIKNVVALSELRDNAFGKGYGVLIQDGRLAGLLSRAVVVVDAEGQVVYTQQVPEIGQEPDYAAALAVL